MVAARVTTKPGVAGRRMDIYGDCSVLSENERGGDAWMRRVVKSGWVQVKIGCLAPVAGAVDSEINVE